MNSALTEVPGGQETREGLGERSPYARGAIGRSEEETAPTRWYALALSSVFCALELINIRHHPMWRDEIQVWSLARHSRSLLEFLSLKRYEDLGHPDAWHLLVYPVSRIATNPFAMQLLHLAIATLTAYVVARHSPFSRLQKALTIFGYFFFYEYATISRGYAFGVLCVFVFCSVFRPGVKKNYALLATVLGLMAQANLHALILALALASMLVLEAVRAPDGRNLFSQKAGQIAFAATLFSAAVLVSILRMQPPADTEFYPSWHFGTDPTSVGRTIAMMWKAFVPIPELSRHFWNTNIVSNSPAVAALSIVVLCVSLLYFLRKPTVLFLYGSGLGGLLLFRHVKYAGSLRHDGHAFILFLACTWLARLYPDESFPSASLDRLAERLWLRRNALLTGILTAQVIAAVIASAIAFRVPFSRAEDTAAFLRANHMDKMFIVGDSDAPLATVAGYLGREIYYPRGDRMGTYIVWDNKRLAAPREPIFEIGTKKSKQQRSDVLVILNYPSPARDDSVREIASFEGSIVENESYFVYLVPYQKGKIDVSGQTNIRSGGRENAP